MSRNTLVIAAVAVFIVIILFSLFSGGGDEAPAPEAGAEAPAAQ
ncbi:hypothetical protein [Tropicimonas aquimaris]|uniref:Uncharacterized protein n=1 Tax=Tropicimonas aquimaris TaxID=914152 RepID=A0ABW3IWJ8_9RHOB